VFRFVALLLVSVAFPKKYYRLDLCGLVLLPNFFLFVFTCQMIHSPALCHAAEEALLEITRAVFGSLFKPVALASPALAWGSSSSSSEGSGGYGLPVAVKLFGFLCAQLQKGPSPLAGGGGADALGSHVSLRAELEARDGTRRFCLQAVRAALDACGGGGLAACAPLRALVRDDLCANLLWLARGGQPRAVSAATVAESLAVVRCLWGRPLRGFLKVQFEALFLGVFLRHLKHLAQV
jgi:hypothetical protein